MTEYSSSVALASRLIKKKGRSGVSVYRPTPNGVSDPNRPWKLDVPVTDLLLASGLHAVFLDQRQVRGDLGQQALDLSMRSLVYMPDSLMPGATMAGYFIPSELLRRTLEVGDLVVTAGHRYSVLRCDPLQPGDELVLYIAHLKE